MALPEGLSMDIHRKAELWAEWIAQGVYDQPLIETREEFKSAIEYAILDVAKDFGINVEVQNNT